MSIHQRRSMIRCSLTIALITTAMVACGGDSTQPSVATTIDVKASKSSLYGGDTARFTATVRDDRGVAIPAAQVTWTSGDTTRLRVDATGLATVVFTPTKTEPSVLVRASYGSIPGSASVAFVFRPPFDIWPDTNVLSIGASRTLVSRVINGPTPSGVDIVATPADLWRTSDANVATVDPAGIVTAKATGHVQIVGSLAN